MPKVNINANDACIYTKDVSKTGYRILGVTGWVVSTMTMRVVEIYVNSDAFVRANILNMSSSTLNDVTIVPRIAYLRIS